MNPDQSCDHKGIIAQVGVVIQSFLSTEAPARRNPWNCRTHCSHPAGRPRGAATPQGGKKGAVFTTYEHHHDQAGIDIQLKRWQAIFGVEQGALLWGEPQVERKPQLEQSMKIGG